MTFIVPPPAFSMPPSRPTPTTARKKNGAKGGRKRKGKKVDVNYAARKKN